MKSALYGSVVGLALIASIQGGHAQSYGDVAAGFAYADGVCSECHAVKKGQRVSPHERATAFEIVANAPGMNDMALRVWFQSPHPSMPNLVLKDKTADDLIAYIMSLKRPR